MPHEKEDIQRYWSDLRKASNVADSMRSGPSTDRYRWLIYQMMHAALKGIDALKKGLLAHDQAMRQFEAADSAALARIEAKLSQFDPPDPEPDTKVRIIAVATAVRNRQS